MRILTVRQPWAWAIIHGEKDVENRIRNIAGSYRGPLAIHAGKRFDLDAPKSVQGDFHDHPYARDEDAFGAIIGVVDLVDVHPSNDERCERFSFFGGGSGVCSEWAELGAHHLEFANPRALGDPIPYKGALGLRRLDDEMVARIEAAIA